MLVSIASSFIAILQVLGLRVLRRESISIGIGLMAEEPLHVRERARARQRRQGVQEQPAVALAEQARIAQHQHAAIFDGADQAAGALLERDHRLRQLLVAERIAAGAAHRFQPRLEHRIVGRGERQLVDHHHAQRVAGHVHAFAETRGAQQHAVAGFAESLQQHVARRIALHEQRPRAVAQRLGGFAQGAVRGEQQERAAAARPPAPAARRRSARVP